MAQHDYSIANATGLNFRNDLNACLAAVVTQNAGSTEPNPAFPGMLWLDLSSGVDGTMRRRNQANNAWLTDIGVDQTARNAAAAAQAKADRALLRDNTATQAERTMALPLILPNTVPANHEAVSRAQADLLYQVKLPTASVGTLLVGAAGGWTSVLPPGADGGLLVQSGGVPLWQNPATVAAPNAIVKTKADGTIDSTFIPQVASGLKFCGTFKPVVNDEYPTAGDGGHGAGGAPAIGDFWVIDGLTTAGYTYLTGSLAGVTVYNGDSIAFNGASTWYRMGSSVALQGYMKLDGSTAMTGNLDMGVSNQIINVAGIVGRPGQQVPLTNFMIEQSSILISPQRAAGGAALPVMPAGQIATDLNNMQIVVGASAANTNLLPVRYHSVSAAYGTSEYVYANFRLQRANAAVAAGAFTQSQWSSVVDTAGYATFLGPISFKVTEAIKFLNLNTGNTNFYFNHSDTGFALATSKDDGTFNKVGWEVERSTGMTSCNNFRVWENYWQLGVAQIMTKGGGATFNFLGSDNATGRFAFSHTDTGWVLMTLNDTGGYRASAIYVQRAVNSAIIVAGPLLTGFSDAGVDTGQIIFGGGYTMNLTGKQASFAFNGGPVYASAFTPTSDSRLKEDIVYRNARSFDTLQVARYRRTDPGHDGYEIGPIAQDVQAVAPEHVRTYAHPDVPDALAVDLMGLTYEMVVNALTRIRVLEGKAAATPTPETP